MGDDSHIADDGQANLELIAAGLRRDAEDTRLHGQVVLESLANALPPELARVERSGGLVRKSKVVGVHISVGDRRYVLKTTPSGLASSVCHESGGIVMSTTPVEFDAWVRELLDGAVDRRRAQCVSSAGVAATRHQRNQLTP